MKLIKNLIVNLRTKPSLWRVALALVLTAGAYLASPAVLSLRPSGFPPELGPILAVIIPAVILKLIHHKLSFINSLAGSFVMSLIISDLARTALLQQAGPWGSLVYFGTAVAGWYGALRLWAWLAELVVNHHAKGQLKRALIIAGGIVAFVAVCLIGLDRAIPYPALYKTASLSQAQTDARRARIVAIYDRLGLSADYQKTAEDIFGEKRIYSYDNGRTFSSSRTYVRAADVDATVAELRPLIEQAGFTFIGEPYPGSADPQLHFRSAKGEYVRLSVSSKPRDEAIRNARGKTVDYAALSSNAGPSNVLIKVNLDDNNE